MNANQRIAWDSKYDSQGALWSRLHDDWFRVGDNDLVLDLGSGSGKSARSMSGEVIALDFSLIALKAAKKHLPAVSAICADIRNLPFRESVFDFIRASFVLDHLNRAGQDRAMARIKEIMKPGASIAVECFSVSDGRYAGVDLDRDGDFIDGDGIFHHPFDGTEIADLMSGLEIKMLSEKSWEQGIGSGEKMNRCIIRVLARKQDKDRGSAPAPKRFA